MSENQFPRILTDAEALAAVDRLNTFFDGRYIDAKTSKRLRKVREWFEAMADNDPFGAIAADIVDRLWENATAAKPAGTLNCPGPDVCPWCIALRNAETATPPAPIDPRDMPVFTEEGAITPEQVANFLKRMRAQQGYAPNVAGQVFIVRSADIPA